MSDQNTADELIAAASSSLTDLIDRSTAAKVVQHAAEVVTPALPRVNLDTDVPSSYEITALLTHRWEDPQRAQRQPFRTMRLWQHRFQTRYYGLKHHAMITVGVIVSSVVLFVVFLGASSAAKEGLVSWTPALSILPVIAVLGTIIALAPPTEKNPKRPTGPISARAPQQSLLLADYDGARKSIAAMAPLAVLTVGAAVVENLRQASQRSRDYIALHGLSPDLNGELLVLERRCRGLHTMVIQLDQLRRDRSLMAGDTRVLASQQIEALEALYEEAQAAVGGRIKSLLEYSYEYERVESLLESLAALERSASTYDSFTKAFAEIAEDRFATEHNHRLAGELRSLQEKLAVQIEIMRTTVLALD